MSAKSHVWWWSAKRSWASQVDGKRALLAKGRKNKKVAEEKLCKILAERQLLSTVDGPISVASLCEQFLADTAEALAPATYTSYRYACQLLVDQLGHLQAHATNQRMQHLRKRAGFGADVIPYTLRHRGGTKSILATGDLKMTSLLLGHQSTATTERYTHIAQHHLVTVLTMGLKPRVFRV